MAYRLGLHFTAWNPKTADLRLPSEAKIYVKHHTSDEDGHIFLTPDCVTLHEVKRHVKLLKAELDEMVSEASRRFATQKERERRHRR